MSPKTRELCLFLLRVVLAGVYFYAGASKLGSSESFARAISNYHLVPPWSSLLLALSLPWLELLVAGGLLLGLFFRATAWLSSLLTLTFALAIGSAVARGLDIDCGCFSGQAKADWTHLLIDLALLAASLTLAMARSDGALLVENRLGKRLESQAALGATLTILLLGDALYIYSAAGSPAAPLSGPTGIATPVLSEIGPSLVFDKPTLDFGALEQGKVVEGHIGYRNVSKVAIEIAHVEASCGCTTGKPTKTRLPPGDSGSLDIRFESGSKRGPVTSNVSVFLKGQSHPVELTVAADVQPIVQLSPLLVTPQVGKPALVKMTALKPGLEFGVVKIETPTPQLHARVISHQAGSAILEVSVSDKLPAPQPPIDAWSVYVWTDLAGIPPFEFYVRGTEAR